ncbi:hypothetical protein [uncultured Rikenella sp.]|nr:hypothetical protein [uncultured Rikenella sp.]
MNDFLLQQSRAVSVNTRTEPPLPQLSFLRASEILFQQTVVCRNDFSL